MKKQLLALSLLLAFVAPSWAQVQNGAQYTNAAGQTVTVSVTVHALANVAKVTYSDDVGKSPTVNGTPSNGGVSAAKEASTWGEPPTGGGTAPEGGRYRVKDDKAQEKLKGKWKSMTPKPEPGPKDPGGGAGTTGTLPSTGGGGGGHGTPPPGKVHPISPYAGIPD